MKYRDGSKNPGSRISAKAGPQGAPATVKTVKREKADGCTMKVLHGCTQMSHWLLSSGSLSKSCHALYIIKHPRRHEKGGGLTPGVRLVWITCQRNVCCKPEALQESIFILASHVWRIGKKVNL